MDEFDTAHLIYLIMLGCAVVFWFVASNRDKLGTVVQQALIWGLIFIGVIAAIGLWDDIRSTVLPSQSVSGAGRIELPRHPDGHYYLTATVNGEAIEFVVDTGATDIVLTREDARNAGLNPDDLAYSGTALTANGVVATAPVRLETVEIGPIRDTDIRAVVNGGELDQSLLGMSYLQRYSSVEITNGTLVLRR
ncbi:TIGR02281 family clan AA aspartic protease [uncultured Roseovarius sp.]|uniref:retropepsin-like aspartic protease family protein n=1 Tax=uncultured Roseovarius sp. TaxID=293344 RepID=UPI0026059613|nr:TIGR02281 family clan AA aspartic protease [uncultured Roseovarius sp.]